MKRIYRVSASQRTTRLILIIFVFFLSSCGDRKDIDLIISREDFTPRGLSGMCHLLCFDSDSSGYAATPLLTEVNGEYYRETSVISKTVDRGRTWDIFGRTNGNCISITEYGDMVFFVTNNIFQRNFEYGNEHSEIWFTKKDAFSPQKIAAEDDEIFGFHAFNDSTFCYLCYNHGEIGSFYLTKNYGMSWETFDLPGSIVGINCAYIGNKIAVPLHDKNDKYILYIKDIIDETTQFFKTGYVTVAQAADSLLACSTGMVFYKYDGQSINYLSRFNWSGYFGRYFPKLLIQSSGIYICAGAEFFSSKKKRDCIFYSSDNGSTWHILSMGEGVKFNDPISEENNMASIPEKDGAAVIYQCLGDDRLHIIKVQKSDNAGD